MYEVPVHRTTLTPEHLNTLAPEHMNTLTLEHINTSPMSTPYLKIENVEIAFNTPKGKFVAVKDINLDIEKGQIVSIIGHSGCGKSTILNAISGMLFPTKGSVVLNGKTIKGPGPDRGIVFQNYSLLPWLTVYENIFQAVDAALPQKKSAEKKELVKKYLKMVNL